MFQGGAALLQPTIWLLAVYLDDVTLRVIREEVPGDASEAAEVVQTLPSGATAAAG